MRIEFPVVKVKLFALTAKLRILPLNLPLLEKLKPSEARLLFATTGLLSLWFYSSVLIKPLLKSTMQKKQMIEAKMVQLHKNHKAIEQKSALQKAFESLGTTCNDVGFRCAKDKPPLFKKSRTRKKEI